MASGRRQRTARLVAQQEPTHVLCPFRGLLVALARGHDRPLHQNVPLPRERVWIGQMCYIGVTNPQNPRVESAQEIADALVRAATFIPKERLASTDDCGFSPFSIDEKPNHGSPDYARDVAFQKIANRIQGTRAAAEKLGVGNLAMV